MPVFILLKKKKDSHMGGIKNKYRTIFETINSSRRPFLIGNKIY